MSEVQSAKPEVKKQSGTPEVKPNVPKLQKTIAAELCEKGKKCLPAPKEIKKTVSKPGDSLVEGTMKPSFEDEAEKKPNKVDERPKDKKRKNPEKPKNQKTPTRNPNATMKLDDPGVTGKRKPENNSTLPFDTKKPALPKQAPKNKPKK